MLPGALFLVTLSCCHVPLVGNPAIVVSVVDQCLIIGLTTITGAAWDVGMSSLLSFGITLWANFTRILLQLCGPF